ncbi:SIR2 family protein [Aeromicrobium sp. Leaf291]|uniref:SIR2 family protein n=1 Tax=Aeromicrobium sp. Leaf291 TaxID=1736325 RepID=UPI0006F26A5E|nr:SIR2 family protein [Aeromicrobium sp. Leaf291]KQP84571.1 hypothetical protein ASF35_06705 [Aeromicrobium sp. Leaf291]
MTTVSTLQLLQEVIREHDEKLDDAGLAVIPCVHDDADTEDDAELFGAAIRRAGGVYVRCSPEVTEWSFPGPLNEPMARHLESLCGARNVHVEIFEQEGKVEVLVEGSDELTASALTLAQVLALLSSSLLATEFVVYSYTLDGLDEARAAVLWDAGWSAQHFAPAQLKTLAFVACGWVDVMRHCNPAEGAARLVVQGSDVIRRQLRRTPDMRTARILRSLDDPIVLFMGAGASASARIPQGNALRDSAISHLTGAAIGSTDLIMSFREYLVDHPARFMVDERDLSREQFERGLTLERVLREEFHTLSGRPRADSETVKSMTRYCSAALDRVPPGREAIWELASILPRLIVATVNFDELIESGMAATNKVAASVSDFADAVDLVGERVHGETSTLPILKVHGSIADAETLVADIETTSAGLLEPIRNVLDRIVSEAGRITWVWIGCSMRDIDLRQWLWQQRADQIEEYWVDPLPPRSVLDYANKVDRTQQWAVMGQTLADRQVTESSDVFLPALLERARWLATQRLESP